MARCKVVGVIEGQDMRRKLELLESRQVRMLKRGQCIVALNSLWTMARIVDWQGGLHEYRAPAGEYFDLISIRELIYSGLSVSLDLGRFAEETLEEAA